MLMILGGRPVPSSAPPPAPAAPTKNSDPVISGTAQVAQTLTCTPGSYSGTPTPTVTRQWKSAATSGGSLTNISGATSLTYIQQSGDETKYIKCVETATNASGSTTGTSNELGPVAAAPAGTGFTTRPYLFQADSSRLLASISAGDAQATGSASNNNGDPLGFVTLCLAAEANRGSYSDVPLWQLAICAWLTSDTSMTTMVYNEVMTIVNTTYPGGISGTSDPFQHSEEWMMNVAMSVDCCYSAFSSGERTTIASWINNTMDNWNTQNTTFWPFSAPENNYWQNGFLACVIAGICSEGWNSSASTWRTQASTMASTFAAIDPPYSGPVMTEGGYYSSYVSNAIWAMQLYDAVMGTAKAAAANFSATDTLDMVMYMTRPAQINYFMIGSEPSTSDAAFTHIRFKYWYHMIASAPSSTQAKQAKAILAVAEAASGNFYARQTKGFVNFYWNIKDVASYTITDKADRLLAMPSPGAAFVGLTTGWATTSRKALMFAYPADSDPAYSHANPDAPGFQWSDGADWLITDPEFYNSSGILAEAGSGIGAQVSNIITNGTTWVDEDGGYADITHAHDNTGASIPHYHIQIDAQPYWNSSTVYRRDYVWLDSMQVLVMFDRVNWSGTKTFRLHVPVSASISSGVATMTINSKTFKVRDLYSTGGGAMTNAAVSGITGTCYRISQTDATADMKSLKVLELNSRVSAASYASGSGYHEAQMTINGSSVTVRCYENGSVPLVS